MDVERIGRLWPVFLGLAVPASAFGPVPMAVAIPVAAILFALNHRSSQLLAGIFVALKTTALGRALIFLFATWLVSTLDSLNLAKSLATWARMGTYLGLAFFVFSVFREREDAAAIYKKASLVFSTVVLVYIALVFHVWPELFTPIEWIKGYRISPYNFFKAHASTAVVFLPFLVWAGWTLGGWWKQVCIAIVFLSAVLIYSSGGELSLAGLAGFFGAGASIALTCAVVSVPRRTAQLIWIAAFAAAAGIMWWVGAQLPEPPFLDQNPDTLPFVDPHRELIWGFVLNAHESAPFFGVGPNSINYFPGANVVIEQLNQEFVPSHPHNWILEILSETGWIGFGLLAASIFLTLRLAVRGMYIDRLAALAVVGSSGAYWVTPAERGFSSGPPAYPWTRRRACCTLQTRYATKFMFWTGMAGCCGLSASAARDRANSTIQSALSQPATGSSCWTR